MLGRTRVIRSTIKKECCELERLWVDCAAYEIPLSQSERVNSFPSKIHYQHATTTGGIYLDYELMRTPFLRCHHGSWQVIPGDELHPRHLSLRASGRPNPLVFELDSNELYDVVSKVIIYLFCFVYYERVLR